MLSRLPFLAKIASANSYGGRTLPKSFILRLLCRVKRLRYNESICMLQLAPRNEHHRSSATLSHQWYDCGLQALKEACLAHDCAFETVCIISLELSAVANHHGSL